GYRYAVDLDSCTSDKVERFTIHAHQVVLRHGPANEIDRSFPTVAAALKPVLDSSSPERLPDDVRKVYVCRSRALAVHPTRTTWRDLVKLCARPEGDAVRRNARDIYRIRIWL